MGTRKCLGYDFRCQIKPMQKQAPDFLRKDSANNILLDDTVLSTLNVYEEGGGRPPSLRRCIKQVPMNSAQ